MTNATERMVTFGVRRRAWHCFAVFAPCNEGTKKQRRKQMSVQGAALKPTSLRRYTPPMRWLLLVASCAWVGLSVAAQENGPWEMQQSGTTAGLRGVDSIDGKIVWASGTGGTVLKTADGGAHWEKCA